MRPEATDGELIRASLEDPSLFGRVFERHHAAIHAYLSRRAGPDDAGDLAGDVFATAFKDRRKFRPDVDKAAPWLYGIANNLVRRHWRKAGRQARAYGRAAIQLNWIDPTEASDARVDVAQVVDALTPTLERLRPRDREILYLYALAELSYEEVAEATGVPIGTVRSSLSRTRSKLRQSLDQIGDDGPTREGGP